MGIQSARVTSEVSEMSKFPPFFPPPDCLPIRCWVQNGGPFGYLPNTFPSRIIIVCGIRVAETPARKSIDTHYEQPTSPLRPTAKRSGRRGLFLSAIFRAPQTGAVRRSAVSSDPPAQSRDSVVGWDVGGVNHRVPREMWNLFGKKKTPAEMLRCARDSDPLDRSRRVEPAGTFLFFRADDVWPRVRALASARG
jgi:hypothetical protein